MTAVAVFLLFPILVSVTAATGARPAVIAIAAARTVAVVLIIIVIVSIFIISVIHNTAHPFRVQNDQISFIILLIYCFTVCSGFIALLLHCFIAILFALA